MIKKTTIAAVALLAFAFSAVAEMVSQETALAVAEGFIRPGGFGARLLPDRSVSSATAWGNLWIVALESSGHIILAGSDKCSPITFFSSQDFVEPEVGSPFSAKLTSDSAWVAEKEADGSADVNPEWAKLTAPATKKRTLLKSAPSGTTGVVGPLMNCGWGQGAPFNDLSPLSSLCGCMATAAGQEHRYWRWPYRYEKSRLGRHGLRNSLNEYSEHVMRPDGRVAFNYDKVVAYAPNPSSTPWATDKEATYQTAFLSLWMQSLTGMSYKPGASGGTQKLCNFAEDYWFERGPVMSYWRDGYTNLWNAIKADLDFGSPIQVNSPGHQMVVDGYAIANEGAENEAHYININYGWGNPEGWVNLLTAVTESTSGGRLADFQIGYRPQKIVQFEPLPKVSTNNVTLTWHLPPCYTNRTTGFTIEIAKAGGATTSDMIATHEETTTYTATGLEVGGSYIFTVTPVMSDNSEARSNVAVTTIGTPRAEPEIKSVSSVACGIDLVQQGFYIECGRGITNKIAVTCSTSVTSLKTYSSHLTVLPDEKVTTVNNGNGSWTVNVDATTMAKDWDGDMLILTLVAANDDGTEAYKNLMLRFNSMRQELGGTYDIVETTADNAVWFCGTTTLDAKGQNVTFGAGAFCGTGTITLTDSVGNGSFTFQGLGNFTGTLKWAPSVTVNLPADMSNFRGTLWFEFRGGEYTLSACEIPASANIYVAANTQITLVNSEVNAAVSGNGVISVTSGTSKFGDLKGFSGSINLGTQESAANLTLNAGEEKSVEIWNGTLYLTLSKAQVAYGYSTSEIVELQEPLWSDLGKLVFQDENGKVLASWTQKLSVYSISSSANTWTPDGEGAGNFWDAARWSQGLPSAGDYVIFNDTVGNTEMTLNLTSDFNLGYVLVTGTKLTISADSGSATLSVDTFRNTAIAAIATLKCAPTTVVPEGKLRLQSGLGISCDVDGSLADNMKYYHDDTLPAMYFADIWKGTVVFADYAAVGLDLSYWANTDSVVRLNGVAGYLTPNKIFPYTVELVDNGDSPALSWSDGSSGAQSTFDILTGTGTFKTSGSGGSTEKVLIKDISCFTGSFNLAAKNVAIADAMPEGATASNGRIYIEKEVEISAGKGWAANGGLYLGAGANLAVSGAFATGSAINTYGEGTVLTLEDGGSVKVNGAIAGDNAPTLNFKAGTYQITRNVTETKTVNFCAAVGKYTTLDADGNTFTLGANFFSGSGDVYLKTSTSGGMFVIQGIPATYTGTIYVDNSVGFTISGDLSQMGGKINISDITLSRNSSNIGKIDVCSGSTLQVVLTDDEAMDGFAVTGVTLNGGTIEFVDQRGTVVGSSTESLVYVKPANYTVPGPEPVAVWDGDFGPDELTKFSGYELIDWNTTHGGVKHEWGATDGVDYSDVTIDKDNQGLMFRSTIGLAGMTVLVRYSNLQAGTNKRVLFTSTINSDHTGTRSGIRLGSDGKLRGMSGNQDWNDDRNIESGSVDESGVLAFTYSKAGTYLYKGNSAYDLTEAWGNSSLKWSSDSDNSTIYGAGIGGYCAGASANGYEAAKGMTITGLAMFDRVLTTSELKYFRWPSEESSGDDPEPEPEPTLTVSPASGAVEAGTKMAVICDDPTATIWYKKLEDEEYTEYTDPVALETGINYYYVKVNGGKATLYTYLVASPAPEPEYEGPDPVAVWVAGEFDDDRSAHAGLEVSLNGNTTNALGQIVIGNSTTLGATIALPDGFNNATMLVKYEIPSGGAPTANSVPASMFVNFDMGGCAGSGSSDLVGYFWNTTQNPAVIAANYAFSSPAPSIPQEGYLLISVPANSNQNPGDHYTAVYVGETVATLSGGEASSLRFTGGDNRVTSVGVGGPTVAGAVPWSGMVIKSVAIFDEWVTTNDLANYTFPAQGAVRPVDSDRYIVEPVVSWVNDFKTTEKDGYTLSVSGTTAAKGDTFGGTLTIGDAAAIIDTAEANSAKLTVLIKYRAASNVTNAPVVAFGGMATATVGLDVGVYTKLDKTLAVYRNFSSDNGRPYDFETAPLLSATGGYVLCARNDTNLCMAYVGESIDSMTGGEVANSNILFSNVQLKKLGIGGNSGMAANANDMVPFAGLEVEKVVVFNGYYTPDQIRYVPNPEEGDTVNIAANTTWNFAASNTPREYTNIGTISSSGTIAITNAFELAEGTYPLATWTTPQIMSSGYGRVGTLTTVGLPANLTAELVYGANAIYLRVYNPTEYAARPKLKVMPYGDSITEGFNSGSSGANYRALLAQKLTMLGYNVEMVGCYGQIQKNGSGFLETIDPSGQAVGDKWKWHSAKHGATLGITSVTSWQRAALVENVDTLCAVVDTPDVVLLHGGINDLSVGLGIPESTIFIDWTNVVWRILKDLPNTKVVASTTMYACSPYAYVSGLNAKSDTFNSLVKAQVAKVEGVDEGAFPAGRVLLADLNSLVKAGEAGIMSSDGLHPDWWGDDQMAEGWLSVITNVYPSVNGTFPSSTPLPEVAENELGAAAKEELADYIAGFKLCRTITPTGNMDTENPYSATGDGVTENIGKVGYFVEYVRADNNSHKWVWVDMDAFGTTIGDVGLPTANHQTAVTKLHVKSNHNGIEDVAANNDSVEGWIEFSPYNYAGNESSVNGAPTAHGGSGKTMLDWNDTLSGSGSYGCMQVFRKAPTTRDNRPAQLLFAYNNWNDSDVKKAEFGIGNFAQHFWGGAQTLDYTNTKDMEKMNAGAYSVKRIEIWTREKMTDTDYPTPYAWIDMYFPELVSGWDSTQYNDFATNKNHSSVKNGCAPWESYVLGLDPTNETSKFLATIRMNGTTPIVEYSPTNTTLGNITYVLQGKPALSNDWQNVEFDEPGATNRFFRVKVTW